MEYFLILIGFLISAIVLHKTFKVKIFKSRKHGIATILTFFIIGTVWDYFATWRKHWIFPGNGLLGIRIFWLPIEEFLFILILCYFGLTIFRVYEKIMK